MKLYRLLPIVLVSFVVFAAPSRATAAPEVDTAKVIARLLVKPLLEALGKQLEDTFGPTFKTLKDKVTEIAEVTNDLKSLMKKALEKFDSLDDLKKKVFSIEDTVSEVDKHLESLKVLPKLVAGVGVSTDTILDKLETVKKKLDAVDDIAKSQSAEQQEINSLKEQVKTLRESQANILKELKDVNLLLTDLAKRLPVSSNNP